MADADLRTAKQSRLVRAAVDALYEQTRGRIGTLDIVCDGDMLTIRGEVGTYYLWQLGFIAARNCAQRAGGLPFDYQVKVNPPQTA
jgi:hypothetical protein